MALKIRGNTQIQAGSVHNEQLKDADVSLSKLAVVGTGNDFFKMSAGSELKFGLDNNAALKIDADTYKVTASGEVVIEGNLTVKGTQTIVESNQVNIGDDKIMLNADLSESDAAADGGIIVNRGSSADVEFIWDESEGKWSVGSESMIANTFYGEVNVSNSGTNFIDSASTLKAADILLDSALQAEVDARVAAVSAEATARANADSAEATARANADLALASDLSDEESARIAADSAEQTARIAGDAALASDLSDEESARIAADSAEQTARIAGDAALASDLSDEESARIAADSAEQTARIAGDAALASDLSDEISARTAAVSAEATARANADLALASDLSDEESARIAADSAEQTARIAGDAALASDLSDEISARTAAVSAEQTARIAGDAALASDLSDEISARTAGDSALQSELDNTQSGAGLSAAGAYVADSNSNYLDSAVSLFDADMKLDAQLKTLSDNISSGAISGGNLEMKMGVGAVDGLMVNVVRVTDVISVSSDSQTEIVLSEVIADHISNVEEAAMVFINGQKLRSSGDYNFSNDGTNTTIDFAVTGTASDVDLENGDVVEVVYFSAV